MESYDGKTVICNPEKSFFNNEEKGLVRPLLIWENDQFKAVDRGDFPNNGLVHIIDGYKQIQRTVTFKELPVIGPLWAVELGESYNWTDISSGDDTSRYSSHRHQIKKARAFDVIPIISASSPKVIPESTLRCRSSRIPCESFMIQDDEGYLYGPMEVEQLSELEADFSSLQEVEFSYRAYTRPLPASFEKLLGVSHCVLKIRIDELPKSAIVESEGFKFLCSPFLFESAECLDLISDQALVKSYSQRLRKSPQFRDQSVVDGIKALEQSIISLDEGADALNEVRLGRVRNLIRGSRDTSVQLIGEILDSEVATEVLRDALESDASWSGAQGDPEQEEKRLAEEIEKAKEAEQDEAAKKIAKLSQERTSEKLKADAEIADLKRKVEGLERTNEGKVKKRELDSLRVDVQETIERLKGLTEQADAKEKEVADKERILGEYDSLEQLQGAVRAKQNELLVLKGEETEKRDLLQGLNIDIRGKKAELTQELIQFQLKIDALTGAPPRRSAIDLNVELPPSGKVRIGIDSEEKLEVQIHILEKINEFLNASGRSLDESDLFILIAMLLQNKIFTFIGPPGSGKTTMATLLAQALDLHSLDRFVHLQVQRGWTQPDDIIGFYNSLHSCWEPDQFGLYRLMKGLQSPEANNSLSLVLLDEVNLSPVEHYFSKFLGAIDEDSSSAFVIKGVSDTDLCLPESLRFIATANSDFSVEPFTRRYLDRSPVFRLEGTPWVLEGDSDRGNIDEAKAVDLNFSDLIAAFGRGGEILENERSTLVRLQESDEFGKIISISSRKYAAISSFLGTTRPYFDEYGSRAGALDSAITHFCLPMLSGYGRDYGEKLKKLEAFLRGSGLNKSAIEVSRIMDESELDNYSFI